MKEEKQKHEEFIHWYDSLNKNNILLMFKGDFNQELITSLVLLIKGLPEITRENVIVRNRIAGAVVECLQNICRHGESSKKDGEMEAGLILISKRKEDYIISTGNTVLSSSVESLRYYLNKVNSLNKKELKEFHKEVLINTELFGKYGADLGLINLARKSNEKFKFDFHKFDDKYYFFSFEISISTIL
ncbi:MAG: SiaB family protein kinase [Bacteroidota bacterium]